MATSTAQPKSAARLDPYTKRFIPAWLENIANQDLPIIQDAADQAQAPVDMLEVWPKPLLDRLVEARSRLLEQMHAQHHTQPERHLIPALSPEHYISRFLPLWMTEHRAVVSVLKSHTLYGETITSLPRRKNVHMALFELKAALIREGSPPVQLGDAVWLKQVRWDMRTSGGFTFLATIHAINRAASTIILRCDALAPKKEPMSFIVQWGIQPKTFGYPSNAISLFGSCLSHTLPVSPTHRRSAITVSSALSDSTPPTSPQRKLSFGSAAFASPSTALTSLPSSPLSNGRARKPKPVRPIANSWLFPISSDMTGTAIPPNATLAWHNKKLNVEQREAVLSIVHSGQRRVPFLISGPPGTGKTVTLVEAALQILKTHPHARILVCGATGPSADTIGSRLAQAGVSPSQMLRLNDPGRPFEEVTAALLPYCCTDDTGAKFIMPAISTVLSKRVVVAPVIDCGFLMTYHMDNISLQRLQQHMFQKLHLPSQTMADLPPTWTFLLIDEAAQATEPELLVPLSVVLSNTAIDIAQHPPPQVVIVGDMKQLGPSIISVEARAKDLDCSLLGRLFERDIYIEHPQSRRNLLSENKINGFDHDLDVPFVNLRRNYRSHTAILAPASLMFYDDTLLPCAVDSIVQSPLGKWPGLPRPGFPVAFLGKSGEDLFVDEGASFWNPIEARETVSVIQKLLLWSDMGGKTGLRPQDISVISPFREQVWRIRLMLRDVGLRDVDVGVVEAMQGKENRVVILSPVRSSARYVDEDEEKARGLFKQPQRLCVALTRAQELLIVIGEPKLLMLDHWWLSFMRYCHRQKCYTGWFPEKTDDTHLVSRLEELLQDSMSSDALSQEELLSARTMGLFLHE